jgi:hypothetical protein
MLTPPTIPIFAPQFVPGEGSMFEDVLIIINKPIGGIRSLSGGSKGDSDGRSCNYLAKTQLPLIRPSPKASPTTPTSSTTHGEDTPTILLSRENSTAKIAEQATRVGRQKRHHQINLHINVTHEISKLSSVELHQ